MELLNNCHFIKILILFSKNGADGADGGQSPQTLSKAIFLQNLKSHRIFVKLVPDPYWEKQLDPDPDPQEKGSSHW